MPPKRQLQGQTFGRLTVLHEGGRTNAGAVKWICQCECGAHTECSGNALVTGTTRSCGCLGAERARAVCVVRNKRHGLSKTPTYDTWANMRQRCEDPNATAYPKYGARGIRVCEHWQKFENFLADMGERPSPRHSLDRYPNQRGNYEPGNCRWATMREQQNNRSSNHRLTAFGKTLTVQEWVRETGFTHKTILGRLRLGWPIEEALSVKPRLGRNQYAR